MLSNVTIPDTSPPPNESSGRNRDILSNFAAIIITSLDSFLGGALKGNPQGL